MNTLFAAATKTTTPAARTNSLAVFDGSFELTVLSQRFALRKTDEAHVLGRVLTLAITTAEGTRVRVLRGIVRRQVAGGHYSITDEDGCIVGRSVSLRQIVGWSADPISSRLQIAVVKALRKIGEEHRQSFEASMAELTSSQLTARTYAMAA
ncbi:hypothetical protein [Specibacter sp. RAF43]|uniref:hypothetical protein n=1 Tax=Specibacter sp. RAF43 TaxID=3233057 RepID=UPI003F95ED29